MDSWYIVLLGIATWRISRMFWAERGPLDVFSRLRAKLASRQKRMGGLYDLISCFYCVTVWVAVAFALFISDSLLTFMANTFIMSGIAAIIHDLIGKQGKQ